MTTPATPHVTGAQQQRARVAQRPAGASDTPQPSYDELLRFWRESGSILTAPEWKQSDKLTMLALSRQAVGAPRDNGRAVLSLSGRAIAQQLHLSPGTICSVLQNLEGSNLIERNTAAFLCDSQRRLVDPRDAHPNTKLHWEATTEMIVPPFPSPLPPPTGESRHQARARENATKQRQELARLREQVAKLACPCCGTLGEMHIACSSCGTTITDELLASIPPNSEAEHSTLPEGEGLSHNLPSPWEMGEGADRAPWDWENPQAFDAAEATQGEVFKLSTPPWEAGERGDRSTAPWEETQKPQGLGVDEPSMGEVFKLSTPPWEAGEGADVLPDQGEVFKLSTPPAEGGVFKKPHAWEAGRGGGGGEVFKNQHISNGTCQNLNTPQVLPFTHGQVVLWLQRRIGANPQMIHQVNAEAAKYLPYRGMVDIEAYLRGEAGHIYGSRPQLAHGQTWLVAFDVDHQPLEEVLAEARALDRAGYGTVFWQRGDGGHLEVYFDAPVGALAAFQQCLEAAPGLARLSREAFPVNPGAPGWLARHNFDFSWPLFRLAGPLPGDHAVVACPMWAFAHGREWHSPGWRADSATICEALAWALNSATQVPHAPALVDREAEAAPPLRASPPARASEGVSGEPLLKAALRWWHEMHPEAEVLGQVAMTKAGYFALREEDHDPSVCAIAGKDGLYYDHGSKEVLDLFEVHCRLNGLDKQRELWRVADDYLVSQGREPRYTQLGEAGGKSQQKPMSADDQLAAEARALLSRHEHRAARLVAERVFDPKRRDALQAEIREAAWAYGRGGAHGQRV